MVLPAVRHGECGPEGGTQNGGEERQQHSGALSLSSLARAPPQPRDKCDISGALLEERRTSHGEVFLSITFKRYPIKKFPGATGRTILKQFKFEGVRSDRVLIPGEFLSRKFPSGCPHLPEIQNTKSLRRPCSEAHHISSFTFMLRQFLYKLIRLGETSAPNPWLVVF